MMLKKFLKCIREYKLPTVLTLLLMVFEAGIETLITYIATTRLIDYIQECETSGTEISVSRIVFTGLFLVFMALCSLLCGGIGGFTCAKASAGFAKNLRHDIFEKIQTFTFNNIDKFSTASLVTRLTTDVTNVQMAFMMLIRIAIRSPLMLILSVGAATYMGGWLAATFVVIIPFMAFGLIMIAKNAMPAFRSVFKKYDKLNESIEENVRGVRLVKGFSREEYEKEKFAKAADDITKDFTKAERIVAFNGPIMNFCMYFNMAFVLLVGSYMAVNGIGGIKIGQISAMITYGMQILMSLMMLSMIYVMLTLSAESAKRISEILNETPDMEESKNPVTEVKDGSVDFINVSFKYSKEAKNDALSDIDLHIKSGMTVGIIGGTGSSKSTLVQLIPRLYDATCGTVKVGGKDVKEYALNTLRDSVGMVLQKNVMFSGTIKENLRWGNENATDEEIVSACKIACADEFVNSFPDGYDTYIEQGGTNVSGGQKQRLCIARALLKKPKILILDDSTSAVDTKTDAKIRMGFKNLIPNTTKIIIAQRISSVQDADMIIVLDGGKISSIGTHKELLQTSSIYKEVYEQQISGGEADE